MGDLRKDIGILYDMEKNNYLMERAMKQLSRKYNELGIPNQKEEPEKPSKTSYSWPISEAFINALWWSIGGAVVGFIVGCFIFGGFDLVEILFFDFQSIGYGLIGLLIGAVVVYLISLPFCMMRCGKHRSERKKDYQRELSFYKKNLEEVRQENHQDDLRVMRENQEKNAIAREYNLLKSKLAQSQQLLSRFYDAVGIDQSYRNIVPIGYMDEFIRLGISTKLQGADGLYYLVKKELHLSAFHYQLTEIASKLDTIIDQNHEIYFELTRINSQCDNMVKLCSQQVRESVAQGQQLDAIVSNSKIAAYSSSRSQMEQQYQSFLLTGISYR